MDDMLLTPPISERGITTAPPHNGFGFSIWSDFIQFIPPGKSKPEFLDYEILYDPKNFGNMVGKAWGTYRKNVRKWVRNNDNYKYIPIDSEDNLLMGDVLEVVSLWMAEKEEKEEIEDGSVMLEYLLKSPNKKGLYNNRKELVAINIWDENYKFVNFRYCFCKNEPFLSEFARFLFFTDPLILGKDKLVNDGGCLGKESLLFFKKRLNPLSIRNVFSWNGVT